MSAIKPIFTSAFLMVMTGCQSLDEIDEAAVPELPSSCSVYPTPKRVRMTGGWLAAAPSSYDVRERMVKGLGDEGYRIAVRNPGGFSSVAFTVEASTQAGLFYGRQTLDQLRSPGVDRLPCCEIEDAPAIPLRGVVEGFYGRPWGTAGRIRLMDFLGRYKMNTYIYGPKDDPYHHAQWREPYPDDKVEDFRRVLEAARRNFVNFYWAVHLGGAFAGRTPAERAADYAALKAKLELMYAIGFRAFAVFFDDFGDSDAVLHAEISNWIRSEFLAKKGDCARLVACPNVYSGDGDNPYSRKLGELADPEINLMWTGPAVCCEIPAGVAAREAEAIRRSPFVWWNWPVNDFRRDKLLMGRTYGVEPYRYAGFVSNPMENLEASKLGLFGIADMTWNPEAFASDRNWRDGIRQLYPWAPEAMLRFCEHNSDPKRSEAWLAGWERDESVRFASESGSDSLRRELTGNLRASRDLCELAPMNNPELWNEARHWFEMFGLQAQEGLAALNGDLEAVSEVRRRIAACGARHIAHFREMTPEWDRDNCCAPQTATRVVQPMIDGRVRALIGDDPELRERMFPSCGRVIGDAPFVGSAGCRLTREGRRLELRRVMEQLELDPGRWFGLLASTTRNLTGVTLKFDVPDALAAGRLEVSSDRGKTWKALDASVRDGVLRADLRRIVGCNACRWVNGSDRQLKFKIEEFASDLRWADAWQ